jgi:hypothetical protein
MSMHSHRKGYTVDLTISPSGGPNLNFIRYLLAKDTAKQHTGNSQLQPAGEVTSYFFNIAPEHRQIALPGRCMG